MQIVSRRSAMLWIFFLVGGISSSAGIVGIGGCDECAAVDLSHWNTGVDFGVARAAGLQGVIHKATQGTGYVDPVYDHRKEAAEEAGLLWGAYHFGDGSDGFEQARHFLQTVGDTNKLLIALDIEESDYPMNLTTAEEFVSAVYDSEGRYPLVYGSSYLRDLVAGSTETLLFQCPLWLAQWGPVAEVPPGWNNYTLWQYSDGKKGPEPRTCPGIGPCDMDRFNSAVHPSLQHMWHSKIAL